MPTRPIYIATLCALLAASLPAADLVRPIPNTLQLSWPHEHVSMDLPEGTLGQGGTVTIGDHVTPYQVERVSVDGKPIDRAWFIARISGSETTDAKGKVKRTPPPAQVDARFQPGASAPAGISASRDGRWLVIDNGVYEFRLETYADLQPGTAFAATPHWTGGMRTKGARAWDGRAWFEGSAPVAGVTVEPLATGPVHHDYRITYRFAEPEESGVVEQPILALGKQSFRFGPDEIPRENVPKRERHYEVLIRFVAGDPWIEVGERYHLPGDPAVSGYGVHQYYLHWGKPTDDIAQRTPWLAADAYMPIDTATWVRWFLYDVFGGNTAQNWIEARPRPDQKGRPFALLRPRWNQGGGGAQDFALTSGGPPPGKKDDRPEPDANVPAVGVAAAFASKWVGPYAATIAAHAFDGNRGQIRCALTKGTGGESIDGDGGEANHYGQRTFALIVGSRRDISSLNHMVRRHTDWTLTGQINHYVLEWPRDANKAGPNILLDRDSFTVLRRALTEGGAIPEELAAAKAKLDDVRARRAAAGDDKNAIKKIDGELNAADLQVVRALLGEDLSVKLPDAGLWIQRRYQDDFLNPTSRQLRQFPHQFALADLLSGGKSLGGAAQAALGYIMTDPDHWPGWHNGWTPGNPNFHTDKYMPGVMAGAAMLDHPHAADWLAYGRKNLEADLGRVLIAPDGVGYECPGYAGYSLNLQMETARMYLNLGAGNVMAENPLARRTGIWHRKLITPFDHRLERRHAAPHGDTHRWDSGLTRSGFETLAWFFRDADPAFAAELLGAAGLLPKSKKSGSLASVLADGDVSITPADPVTLDWSSQYFYGHGAIMRNNFGHARESFLSIKGGPARGHDHNTELAWHFYADGQPISLDYNCSYHPRGDHAALHNSMTFGNDGVVKHGKTNVDQFAVEEMNATARVGAFATTPVADLFAAERTSNQLTLRPAEPDGEFHRSYPTRKVDPITHRRLTVFVKHPIDSPFTDYLVVRDETRSPEPQQINVHLLARDAAITADQVQLTGQWSHDMLVAVPEATDLRIERRHWSYFDEWMISPGADYELKVGESQTEWAQRMDALKKAKGWEEIPGPDWKPEWKGGKPEEVAKHWADLIDATEGRALIPPPGWTKSWMYGEYQVWLRLHTAPGTPTLWVLYPHRRGTPAPTIARAADGHAVTVTLNGVSETITCSTQQGVAVERDGARTVLLEPATLPELGAIPNGVPAFHRP